MMVDRTGSQVRTMETAQGQQEVHVLEFPPDVPKYLIDELLRHPQWSFMYNETLIEIRDYITQLNARDRRQPQPRQQHQQVYQQQPQQQQQFQTLPVQRVQPDLIQGQGVQVGHLQGVQVDLQGVHMDHGAPSQVHTNHFGQQQVISQPSQSFNQGQGRVVQSQGQFFTQQSSPVQEQVSSFGQPQQQQGTVVIGQPGTFQLDPFIAMTGNIQVDPIQSFNIGQNTGIHNNPVEVSHRRTQTFQQAPQKLQIVSAREMNLIG